MSHIAQVNILVQDLNALARACRRLGLEFVAHQTTYRWYGRTSDNTALPTGFTNEELGHCEHAIRIPGNTQAYELGVVTRRDGKAGYALLWDSWNGGYGLTERVGEKAEKLQQLYAYEVTLQTLDHMQHCLIDEQRLADGSLVLTIAHQGA